MYYMNKIQDRFDRERIKQFILRVNSVFRESKSQPQHMWRQQFFCPNKKPDDHIEIEINLDEIDATSAETKATYKEIEEWVQEHYGFHVTNLNIAQVKQKYGIIERENYNRPKSENSRRPGTTPEKEKAITEALKYFKMI